MPISAAMKEQVDMEILISIGKLQQSPRVQMTNGNWLVSLS
ncbi:MAG: hypothetical protein ACLSE8_04920 [Parasutterella sp.]